MKLSLTLIIALILGLLAGRSFQFDYRALSDVMLYLMLILIGLEMAQKRKEIFEDLKTIGLLSLGLPLMTIIGSMVGGLVVGMAIPGLPHRAAIVITSGCGWYSLTGPYLTTIDPFYGLVGFLTNFSREITMILVYPFMVRLVGPLSSISIGGATTMDSTLPLVRRFGGQKAGVVAFAHGFIVSLLVPFLLFVETRLLLR